MRTKPVATQNFATLGLPPFADQTHTIRQQPYFLLSFAQTSQTIKFAAYIHFWQYLNHPPSHAWYVYSLFPGSAVNIFFFSVNGLDGLIERTDLPRTDQLDPVLSNCGLGIDASHYLRQLYRRESIKASLSSALGGIPAAFRAEVEKDLAYFKKLKTDPSFVFDGLDLNQFNSKDDKNWKIDPCFAKRRAAWDTWTKLAEKGRYADAKDRDELARQTREAFEAGITQAKWR